MAGWPAAWQNGSKIRAATAGGMPLPLSVTSAHTIQSPRRHRHALLPPGPSNRSDLAVIDAEMAGAEAWQPRHMRRLPLLRPDRRRWAVLRRRRTQVGDPAAPVREPLLAATVARLVGRCAPGARGAAGPRAPSVGPTLARRAADAARAAPVLVVDDNAINQHVATRSLQRLGCRVDTAANGREAVELALRTPYALILMDCQMPEMDGYEATRFLRARQPADRRTPIVAMTAGARAEDREACLACGMDDYLSKPFALPDLQRVVTEWARLPLPR